MSHVRSSYLARTLLSSTRPPPPHRCLLALINPKPARSPAPQRRNREVFFPFQCAKLTVIPFFFFSFCWLKCTGKILQLEQVGFWDAWS